MELVIRSDKIQFLKDSIVIEAKDKKQSILYSEISEYKLTPRKPSFLLVLLNLFLVFSGSRSDELHTWTTPRLKIKTGSGKIFTFKLYDITDKQLKIINELLNGNYQLRPKK